MQAEKGKGRATVELPAKLVPIFDFSQPVAVRAAYGGRGSGKTRSFATMSAVRAYQFGQKGISGIILCARQFQKTLKDSSFEEVKRAIEEHKFLADYFEIGSTYIRSRDNRINYVFTGLDRNISSIKSMGRILLCWCDEAEPVTETAWQTLIPTLREEGDGWQSELWVTWNPLRKSAPVEKRFRFSTSDLIKCVELNWMDNPKFPKKLNQDRLDDMENRPDIYAHVWDGDYATVIEGTYFADGLKAAKDEGRIGNVAKDPLMPIKCFWDIGGTGARADATAIWVAQFIGREIRVLDYYEAQGQPLAAHVDWLRRSGYGNAEMILPHDGATNDRIHDVSFRSALIDAGFEARVIPNQGAGAARARIEAVRRLLPSIWFNEATTEGGREALGFYHEKRDEKRGIGLGAEHDWSSHAADAFGLMCIVYEAPRAPEKRSRYAGAYSGNNSWMAT